MKIEKLVLGQLKTNCYVISHNNTAIVIDPACNGEIIEVLINKANCKLKAIFLTHGHQDHIGAVDYLYNKFRCPIYAHYNERDIIEGLDASKVIHDIPSLKNVKVTVPVKYFDSEFTSYDIDGIIVDAVFTPGHSEGSCVYVLRDCNRIFSGDTLFKDGIGRIDLPTSNKVAMKESLKLLQSFKDSCKVLPGHGSDTTIGYEKENNLYF